MASPGARPQAGLIVIILYYIRYADKNQQISPRPG